MARKSAPKEESLVSDGPALVPYTIAGVDLLEPTVVQLWFPADYVDVTLENLKAVAKELPDAKETPEEFLLDCIWPSLKKPLETTHSQLGKGLVELLPKRRNSAAQARATLMSSSGSSPVISVGYRSSRMTPSGEVSGKPRSYLGTVASFNDEKLELDTALGRRTLRMSEIHWIEPTTLKNADIKVIEATFLRSRDETLVSFRFLSDFGIQEQEKLKFTPSEQVNSEEPFLGTNGYCELQTLFLTGSTIALMAPFLKKKVYLEIFNEGGEKIAVSAGRLTAMRCYPHDNYPQLKITIGTSEFEVSKDRYFKIAPYGDFLRATQPNLKENG